jgi:hypothetical protein
MSLEISLDLSYLINIILLFESIFISSIPVLVLESCKLIFVMFISLITQFEHSLINNPVSIELVVSQKLANYYDDPYVASTKWLPC